MLKESIVSRLNAIFATFPCPVVILDVESTGGNLSSDRVTEVAFWRFDRGHAHYFSELINPEKPIPSFVQELTGITDNMVSDKPIFAHFAPSLLPQLQGALLIAHNSHFDYTFLKQEFARAGLDYAAPNLCTVKFSRRLYPEYYKHSLETIIDRFSFILESRHRAMADVEALCMFLEVSLKEKGEEIWCQAAYSLMQPQVAPHWLSPTLQDTYYSLPDAPCVIDFLDNNKQSLYHKSVPQCFSDISKLLHQPNAQERFANLTSIHYQKAIGPLHAYVLAHQDKSVPLHYTNKQPCYTILLGMSEDGYLQTHVKPITESLLPAAPIGLFLHAKAAKKALFQWAQAHQICPKALNILQPTPPKTEPCPTRLVAHCPSCIDIKETANQHNDKVMQHLNLLPCVGFNQHRAFVITETDALLHQQIDFTVQAGALSLRDGQWLFSEKLLQLLKKKIQQDKHAIENLI